MNTDVSQEVIVALPPLSIVLSAFTTVEVVDVVGLKLMMLSTESTEFVNEVKLVSRPSLTDGRVVSLVVVIVVNVSLDISGESDSTDEVELLEPSATEF